MQNFTITLVVVRRSRNGLNTKGNSMKMLVLIQISTQDVYQIRHQTMFFILSIKFRKYQSCPNKMFDYIPSVFLIVLGIHCMQLFMSQNRFSMTCKFLGKHTINISCTFRKQNLIYNLVISEPFLLVYKIVPYCSLH